MSGFRLQGSLLKRYRNQALLTQEQLAASADCSDRVIRKAEAGGVLRYETIELIVAALQCNGVPVTVQELLIGNKYIAKNLMEALDLHGVLLTRHFRQFSPGVRMNVAGLTDLIPFAGSWRGISGINQHLKQFFHTFQRKTPAPAKSYLESEGEVVVRFKDLWQARDKTLVRTWVDLHFVIRDGLINTIEMHYDTHAVYQFYATRLVGLDRQVAQ